MRTITLVGLVLAGAVAVTLGQARQGGGRQGGAPAAQLTIQQVKPGLFAILNPGANTLAVRVTPEGVILVDDMFAQNHEQILALIKSVTDQPVKYVISTHHHGDHTGGNAQFLETAQIIGHKNARAAMTGANPLPGAPPLTYTVEAGINLGGVEVQLHHVGRGHTNGDTVVYFPDLKVMATGDLFVVLPRVPAIDYANGGTSLGWVPTLDNVLKFDFDTVIPGHGPVATRSDLQRFQQNLRTLQTRTRELIKQGVPREQYLTRLKVDDLGWALGAETLFVRNASSGFYDELAKEEARIGRYPAATGGDIVITPVLHASVQLEYRDTVVQVDPWSVADLTSLKKASLILVTDDPSHHLDPKAIAFLRRPGTPVVVTKKGQAGFPEGTALANGRSATLAGVRVESIAAYDLTPGAPEHPKGEASGYLVTLGGRRILIAGVTECVPELLALKDVDVAFMPMNIPPRRMTPAATADCVKKLRPKVVYLQHYDNGAVAAITGAPPPAPGWLTTPTVADSLQAFRNAMSGSGVEVRLPDWYSHPAR
jgi:cyclase